MHEFSEFSPILRTELAPQNNFLRFWGHSNFPIPGFEENQQAPTLIVKLFSNSFDQYCYSMAVSHAKQILDLIIRVLYPCEGVKKHCDWHVSMVIVCLEFE